MRRSLVAAAVVLAAGCGTLLGISEDDDGLVDRPIANADGGNGGETGLESDGDVTTDVNGDSGNDAGADATNGRRPRIVFVTTRTTDGAFGGFLSADAICNAEASDAGLAGSWVAWISTSTVDARSRLVTDAGWSLAGDGGVVFSGPAAITNGSFPQTGIDRGAQGQALTGQAWTGTRADGTTYSSDCAGWTDTAQAGVPGNLGAKDETWTGASPDSCGNAKRLICFEK